MTDKDERIEELERQNQALEARLDAVNQRVTELMKVVIGEQRTEDNGIHHPDLEDELNIFDRMGNLEDDFEDIEKTARTAIATNEKAADGGQTTKKGLAKRKGRNRLVTQLTAGGEKAKIRYTTIADEIESTKIYHQTVGDACDELANEWSAFTTTTDESGKKVLVITLENVTDELAYTVEEDLARDGLAKKLISRREGTGVRA